MERIGPSVRHSLRAAGVPDAGALSAAVTAWPRCVGEAIARAAWPLRLGRDGTLHVACVSSTWAFELGRMAPEVLATLRAELGGEAPSAVRFVPGPVPAAGAPAGAEAVVRPVAPGSPERAAAETLAAAIDDPELREMAARAAAASLARRRADRAF